jgi:hypothetical protein
VRLQAPREVPEETQGHVIVAEYDAIAAGLAERLDDERIPYVIIEPDPTRAGQLCSERLSVLARENDKVGAIATRYRAGSRSAHRPDWGGNRRPYRKRVAPSVASEAPAKWC